MNYQPQLRSMLTKAIPLIVAVCSVLTPRESFPQCGDTQEGLECVRQRTDINQDGYVLSVADLVLLMHEITGSKRPVCEDSIHCEYNGFGDIDSIYGVSISDAANFASYFQHGLSAFAYSSCSTSTYQPPLDSDDTVSVIVPLVPAGASKSVVSIRLKNVTPVAGFLLPLKFSWPGSSVTCDFVDLVDQQHIGGSVHIDSAEHEIVIAGLPNFLPPGEYELARAFFTLAPVSTQEQIQFDTTVTPTAPWIDNHITILDSLRIHCKGYRRLRPKIEYVQPESLQIFCPNDFVLDCSSVINPRVAIAFDPCDPDPAITYTDSVVNGSCLYDSTIYRNWTANDTCGHSASCLQVIPIRDNSSPTITINPSYQMIDCADSVVFGTPTATDNCDGSPIIRVVSTFATAGSCPQESSYTRIWEATDACGNHTSCGQTFVKQDTTPPAITCPPSKAFSCDSIGNFGIATAVDNCDPNPAVTYRDLFLESTCPQESTVYRTWFALDTCGNVSYCVQVISIQDTVTTIVFTPPGSGISVQLTDSLTVTFDSVSTGGTTTVSIDTSGAPLPNGFQLPSNDSPVYYDISTTAAFRDSLTVCFTYPQDSALNETNLVLLHYVEVSPDSFEWQDVTISLDTVSNKICGSVASLSQFIIAQPECIAKPGDANADSSFTLADVIATVNYIFKKSGWPACSDNNYTCWLHALTCRGDWNAIDGVNLADVIRAVNYIFKKTGWPTCPANNYTCWLPPASGVCCLPVP